MAYHATSMSSFLLKTEEISGGSTKGASSASRGCLQGSVLLLLLWSLVVDKLWEFNDNDYYTV
jgi:hypothetical protein